MKIRRIKYYLMSNKKICKLVKCLHAKLKTEDDIDKRFEIYDQMFDILMVLVSRNRNDEEFMEYIRSTLNECYATFKRKEIES